MGQAEQHFGEEARKRIAQAIKNAELKTSGEIRVHIDDRCKEDVLDRAASTFEALSMHKTELRNGVLFYVAFDDHKFAILGDAGINAKVPEHFWDDIRDHVISQFKQGNYTDGLCEGIEMAGKQLKEHFPYQKGDENELDNEITFGNQKKGQSNE